MGASMLLALLVQTAPLPPETWKERNQPAMPRLPACAIEGATIATTLGGLPEALATQLQRSFETFGGMSDAGGPYNGTDVIGGDVPRSRFLRAYQAGDYWIIWFERGGFASGPRTIAYRRSGGAPTYAATPGSLFSGDLCAATRAILAGVRSAS